MAPDATARFDTVRGAVHAFLTSSLSDICLPSAIEGWEDVAPLAAYVERIYAAEGPCPLPVLPVARAAFQIHVYQPIAADGFEELTSGGGRGDDDPVMAASSCDLPSTLWEGLWDSLIYSDDIKSKLLDYIYSTVVFSDADVDCEFSVVSTSGVFGADVKPRSQCRIVEPRRSASRAPSDWEDLSVSSLGSKAFYPPLT